MTSCVVWREPANHLPCRHASPPAPAAVDARVPATSPGPPTSPLGPLAVQLKDLGKSRKDSGGTAAGEPGLSGEELRAQHKRRMLFGQANPRSAAATPGGTPVAAPTLPSAAVAVPAAVAAAAVRGSSSGGQEGGVSPRDALVAGTAAGAALASSQPDLAPLGAASAVLHGPHAAGGSRGGSTGPSSPLRHSLDDVAAAGEVFAPPVAASPQAAGPLGLGLASDSLEPFGSSTMLLAEAPEPDPGQAAAGAPAAAPAPLAQAAERLPMPQPPWPASAPTATAAPESASGGGRSHLATPRWAKQLASKAQKGLHKLRDSLQD